MMKINLNKGWRLIGLPNTDDEVEQFIDLPFDVYTEIGRDFDNPYGEYNGYCKTAHVEIEREFDNIPKAQKVLLDIKGISGVCDVLVNGINLKSCVSIAKTLIDITNILCQNKNIITLKIGAYSDSGKYTGLGISSGVDLIVIKEPIYIEPCGLFVRTASLDQKANIEVSTKVVNDGLQAKVLNVQTELYNQKQKRITKKIKKVKLKEGASRDVLTLLKLSRPYEWNAYDPYLYRCKVSIFEEGTDTLIDENEVVFGISKAELTPKGFVFNNVPLKIRGVVMAHDNGILGNVSELSVELYKLGKIKDMGYNAVRYIGCPSDSVLEALDKLGLMCVVDLFSVFKHGRFLNDGHMSFDSTFKEVVKNSILSLRNHPCVIMYSLGDNIEETYNRGEGIELISRVLDEVKLYDPYTLTTINAFERVPNIKEIEKYDIKVAKNTRSEMAKKLLFAAREKDLFRQCTNECFSKVDVAGYSYLYGRYATDKALQGRVIIGLASYRDKVFEANEELEKNANVIGDFIFAGADFIGAYDMHKVAATEGRPCNNNSGLLDITYRKKELSYYNEIISGKKNGAYILVEEPDLGDETNQEFNVEYASHLWNWPRHIGKNVKIRVVTSGDIVSLTLDKKAIGRKLAGKFNKNIADFKTNFYPGKLEAVSYHKGVEQSRVTLETVTSPKLLKIECSTKSIKENDLCFVDIFVADKEGRIVPYAMRNITVQVIGEGVLEMLGNGDSEHFSIKGESSCPAFNGVVTAVVRATKAGKIILKATSEGLISNKATIKVK